MAPETPAGAGGEESYRSLACKDAKSWLESGAEERVLMETSHDFGGLAPPDTPDDVILGICAMKKKVSSAAMSAFIRELQKGKLSVSLESLPLF